MNKLMITAVCVVTAGALFAQDSAPTPATEPADAPVVTDQGSEAAQQGLEMQAPCDKKFRSAKKVLSDLAADKGWGEGWDQERGRMFVIESATFDTKDPANDSTFFVKREMAAKAAVLQAKVNVIMMINSEMSGSDIIDMPGSDVNKALSADRDKIIADAEAQKTAMLDLIAKRDAAEADVLRGTTAGQRFDDMMSALIKKLDADYDANAHDEAAKARYAELKSQAEASIKAYDELMKKANQMQEEVKERQESAVTVMAKMPIFGVTVVMQTESFNKDKGKYEVAVLASWSKALEASARAIALGQNLKAKPGKANVNDWLRKQDLATMIGPRQYIDDKGDRWYLGITARAYDDDMPSFEQKKAKKIAENFAKQMAVFCVFADVEAGETAKQVKETRGNANTKEYTDQVAEDVASKMTQKFEKKTVRGLQRVASDEVVHPITGGQIYVVVYGINASAAKAALAAETRAYATKIESERHQTVEKGRRAANEAAVRAATNRADDFQKGAQKQTQALGKELQSRQPKKPAGGVRINQQSSGSGATQPKKSQGGTFGGDVDVGDDF